MSAEPRAMTTAGLQAKVSLRQAWFEAHPNQPMPEGREQVERLFAAIEAEARAEAGTLDEAWAAAEAALPEGLHIEWIKHLAKSGSGVGSGTTPFAFEGWRVETTWLNATGYVDEGPEADGPTPAAALLALAAALRAVPA